MKKMNLKNINILITIALLLIAGLTYGQYVESFEGQFVPQGWSSDGWKKDKGKAKTGKHSALSKENNVKKTENFLQINSISITSTTSFSFYHTAHEGNKGAELGVYIYNPLVNNGDTVLIATVVPESKKWNNKEIIFPIEYHGTNNNTILFMVEESAKGVGNDKIYIDDVGSNGPLPVKMEKFTYSVTGSNVKLSWKTIEEINNKGFEVERNSGNGWNKIGFVSADPGKNYSYEDKNLQPGTYQYRLKQIDYNGNYEYHNLKGEVTVLSPKKYSMSQNYPNPFNPVTYINFEIPQAEYVTILIYDISGREVATVFKGYKEAGVHTVEFRSNLASGIYYYKIVAGSFTATKIMTVVK